MRKVTLFTRDGCHLCEAAARIIERVRGQTPFDFECINIDDPDNERWLDEYDHEVPVIHIDGREFARHRLDEGLFREAVR
ncbi:MAG TPA: glutaredoxin family protein [Phycisphaerae bacterium]|nr:glutaredoxin family protein [Phycisphaerae bacterium]HOB73584.1 glutaredoxin family protein [Phycisphaerae bacterium]HOJ55795.1 glutaredoxin family protein [Phycisphaerae bacterium]HOL25837.1 glutaredoxin family protein [Phycisphaerae bacterium]HPP21289.1 glutaredoxin family protein [Phycisphaerae bacterium]